MIDLFAIILPKICNNVKILHKYGSIDLESSLEIKIQADDEEIAMEILDDFISNLIDLGYNVEAMDSRTNNSKYEFHSNMMFSIPENEIKKTIILEKDLHKLIERMKIAEEF
jgi:hypothetical protein